MEINNEKCRHIHNEVMDLMDEHESNPGEVTAVAIGILSAVMLDAPREEIPRAYGAMVIALEYAFNAITELQKPKPKAQDQAPKLINGVGVFVSMN